MMRLPAPRALHGWGRHAAVGIEVGGSELAAVARDAEVSLARGLGRSYGDASLPAGPARRVLNTCSADRILAFDANTARLRAEAGLSLATLNDLFMPRGYFPPVTPGTEFVTLGGMVAADVHGKNQHSAGNIGDHVTELTMLVADGRIVRCSREQHRDLFLATLGGMGLTGIILEVELTLARIPSPWILQESRRIRDLDEFVEALAESAAVWPFSVGWLDCLGTGKQLGRGLLMSGRWAEPHEAPKGVPPEKPTSRVPFDFPELTLNRLSIAAFNEAIFHKQLRRVVTEIVTPEVFWYPLDSVHEWYRMYGRRGFTQYQFVLPRSSTGGIRRVLETLHRLDGTPFLSVLKEFGRSGEGTLSFPMPGMTLAIDLPLRDDTAQVVDRLNEVVLDEGGRIYLAKDSFTKREHYLAMDARVHEFERVRRVWDPERRWKSALSVRMFGDEA